MAQTQSTKITEPIRGFTENGSATFVASGNPCLDFFFQVIPTSPSTTLDSLLTAAWKHDSLTALKLLARLRGVHKNQFYAGLLWLHHNHPKTLSLNVASFAEFGYMKDLLKILFRILHEGDGQEKMKKERRKSCVSKNRFRPHRIRISRLKRKRLFSLPRLDSMPKTARLADYIGVKLTAVQGKNSSAQGKNSSVQGKNSIKIKVQEKNSSVTTKDPKSESTEEWVPILPKNSSAQGKNSIKKQVQGKNSSVSTKDPKSESTEEWVPILPKKATLADYINAKFAEVQEKNSCVASEHEDSDFKTEFKEEKVEKKISKLQNPTKQKMTISLGNKAVLRYTSDTKYQFLYNRVAEFFAAMLTSDLEHLSCGKAKNIGLAARWCPSPDKSFDLSTRFCEAIARLMFPCNSDPGYKSIAEKHYVHRVRKRLKREVLVPIRRVLQLLDVNMSAQQRGNLPYSCLASMAMKRYQKHFNKHDEKRLKQYLTMVEEGTAKISAGALLPHEIAATALRRKEDEEVELQWQMMINDLFEKGTLSNCIAMCDVSGSMRGTPMEVCVALGVLISELSEEPWKGKVISFHDRPSIQIIRSNSLKKKMNKIRGMHSGGSTNFQAVFDQILDMAVRSKLKPEEMVKKVFVFSDMEFEVAREGEYHGWNTFARKRCSWETVYNVICQKFSANGFGDVVPEIVFWNLSDSKSAPVRAKQKGVALLRGFSKSLLKEFLDGKFMPTPEEVMMEAISGKEYQKLAVFD